MSTWALQPICRSTYGFLGNPAITYFRGRRLQGRQIKLPAGFGGTLVTARYVQESSPGANVAIVSENPDLDSVLLEDPEKTSKRLSESGETENITTMIGEESFDSICVWDHEMLPEKQDCFIRGIEEWVEIADKIHGMKETV